MKKEDKKIFQDIYSSTHEEQDMFTPQLEENILKERKQDLKRRNIANFLFGIIAIIISLSLVVVLFLRYFNSLDETKSVTPIMQEYIPRYSLETESQWVLDMDRSFGDLSSNEDENRPFNYFWIKKAIYNMILGEKAYGIKEYKQAINYYEKAYKILPSIEDLPLRLGMCYFQINEFDKAISLFENIPIDDLEIDALNNLGVACINAKSFSSASNFLYKAIEKAPLYTDALKNVAMLNKELTNSASAIFYYNKYLDLRPDDSYTRHNFALYLTKLGKSSLAIEQIDKLLENIKNDSAIYFLKYYNEKDLGNFQKANEAMRRASNLTDPGNPLKWMTDDEFNKFRTTKEFESIMKIN